MDKIYKCLFDGEAKKYLDIFIPSFKTLIEGVYIKDINYHGADKAFKRLNDLYKEENYGMRDLINFIHLGDIRRKNIKL